MELLLLPFLAALILTAVAVPILYSRRPKLALTSKALQDHCAEHSYEFDEVAREVRGSFEGRRFVVSKVQNGWFIGLASGAIERLERRAGKPIDASLGDTKFAARFHFSSGEACARRLTHQARKLLRAHRTSAGRDSFLGYTTSGTISPTFLDTHLRRVHALHELLPDAEDSVDALAEHIATEPEVSYVVERLLRLPAAHHERFAALLADRTEPEIVVECARLRGDTEFLLATSARTEATERELTLAVGGLLVLGRIDEGLARLHRVKNLRWLYTTLAHNLHRSEGAERILGALHNHPGVVRALAAALERFPDAEPLACALALADTEQGPGVEWLAQHGTISSVSTLRSVATAEGENSEVGLRALAAISAIQARSGGAEGSLAIADTGAVGQLSTTEKERGRLAVARTTKATNS